LNHYPNGDAKTFAAGCSLACYNQRGHDNDEESHQRIHS